MEQTLARIGLDRRLDDYRVWQAWDEVVGRTISRNARPVRLDGSRLVVAVRSPTWLQELRLLQGELVSRLNEWMRREVVRELFFVVGRVDDESAPLRSGQAPLGAPQGMLPLRGQEQPAATLEPQPAMEPEAAAVFERLWKAARSRKQGSGER